MIQFSVRFNTATALRNALRTLLEDPTLTEPPADGRWIPPALRIAVPEQTIAPVVVDPVYDEEGGLVSPGYTIPGRTIPAHYTGPARYFNMWAGRLSLDGATLDAGFWVTVLYRGPEEDFPFTFLTNKRVQDVMRFG